MRRGTESATPRVMSTTTGAELSPINHAKCLDELDQAGAADRFGKFDSGNEDIPFVAAALVIAACLTVGTTTAAFVFHDRLVQISATLASR
jgi:hypothetical protein